MRLAALALAATTVTGCLFLRARRPITTDYQSASGVGDAPPVAADDVMVVARAEQLPDGLRWDPAAGDRPGQRLVIDPGFPTADDPHRLLGAVAAKEGDARGRDALLAAARAEAGRHGANLIYLLDDRHDVVTALAVRVSAATSTERFPAAAELLKHRPTALADYRPSGAPIAIDLAAGAPFTVAAKRGQCFALQLALEDDARLSPALSTLSVTRTDARKVGAVNSLAPRLDRRQRTVAGPAGCQLVDGPVELAVGPGRALGSGRALVQVFVRTIDAAEVARRAAEEEAGFAEAAARERERAHADCAQCFPLLVRCGTPDQPSSCREYTSCLARRYVKVDQCR
ncbi:MAG: hypothetical protein IPL61_30950 [Myxococcales bacterium]|nr:hypothetical protein [Myxococcales bacterium]